MALLDVPQMVYYYRLSKAHLIVGTSKYASNKLVFVALLDVP
jgi:hypothetical protein